MFVCVYYVTHFTAMQVANRTDCRIARPIIDRQRQRPCRALQKSPLFVTCSVHTKVVVKYKLELSGQPVTMFLDAEGSGAEPLVREAKPPRS